MWFTKLVRTFFFGLDKIVFNFIPSIYDLLISIARTSVLTQADIAQMADRIYKLLAVFMVFKVTFSLIMYVVNPDDFSDKNKGVGKLTTNIIISLSLLIITPYIFNYAYQLQTIILEDNSLAALVFGNTGNKNFINTAGDDMAYITISPFFTPNVSIEALYPCNQLIERDNNTKEVMLNADCRAGLETLSAGNTNFKETDLNNYIAGVENSSMPLMFRQDLATSTTKNNDEYIMDYKWGISTVVGIVVVLLLITFCMDVAVRSIKLAFLQLIAPIPIISYIDPKSGKDGLFKKWYQMCFKTFLSLFVRLLALYFAVYIISKVADRRLVDIVDGSYVTGGLISIFIIIGALMFVKQLPKILEGLGIKLDGDGKFTLNPLKKFGEQAAGGKKILGLGAAVGAASLAGAANFGTRAFDKNTWLNKAGKFTLGSALKGTAKTVGSTVGGQTSAIWRGSKKAMKGEAPGKIFANSYGEAMFAKLQREDLDRKGSTVLGRAKADINRHLGRLNAGQRQELDLGTLDAARKNEMDKIKTEREKMELQRQSLIEKKTMEQKTHTDNHAQLNAIVNRINTLKGVEDKDGKINVKDRDELVNNLKANDKFYVKVGEEFTDKDGKRRIATEEDVANLVLSDEGAAADAALSKEKDRALKYLSEKDDEVKERIRILNANGIDVSEMNASGVKTEMVKEQNEVSAVNAKYYTQEEEFKRQEEDFKLREKKVNDLYKQQVEERHLDKDSAKWVANAADNAARAVKNPQPEGFKPTAAVDERTYTPFSTGVLMGSGPSGGAGSGGGTPPPPPRGGHGA